MQCNDGTLGRKAFRFGIFHVVRAAVALVLQRESADQSRLATAPNPDMTGKGPGRPSKDCFAVRALISSVEEAPQGRKHHCIMIPFSGLVRPRAGNPRCVDVPWCPNSQMRVGTCDNLKNLAF